MQYILELKTIYDLLGKKFEIPYYQRGYRWAESQVKQLLDDIWEFSKKRKNDSEFYCLQPIVVRKKKKDDDRYEVIDGQQRLTTINLILKFIEKEHLRRKLKEAYNKELYEIDYEVRKESKDFLDKVGESIEEENYKNIDFNIDFYCMYNAFKVIEKWFKDKNFNYNDYNKFLSSLLAREDEDNPVKVIWYEVPESEDSIGIFTRLNTGKIPLTNAELIKALFLKEADSDNENNISFKQLQIAKEWDEIETTLQESSFWYFIYDKKNNQLPDRNYDTRIEYIFDLMKDRKKDSEDFYTFYEFYSDLNENNKDIDSIWREVKKYFYTFKEWYADEEFYHLIGYLITSEHSIKEIKKEYENKRKTEFKEYLKREIIRKISNKSNLDEVLMEIENLNYEENKDKVRKVLLLLNILILLNNKGASIRFPFDRYKEEKWDVEHVFSRTDDNLEGKRLKEYIKLILSFLTGEDEIDYNNIEEVREKISEEFKELADKLIKIYKEKNNEEAKKQFEKIKDKLLKALKEDKIEDRDNISNLVLLDSGTNRSYQNAFFPIKRMRIIEKIKKGEFVPIGTQNVFLKAYSKKFDNIMYWTNEDAKDYLEAIKETFKKFFESGDKNGE